MIEYIIPAAAAIVVAIVEAIASVDRRRARESQQKVEARAERRAEESHLSMRMMSASIELGVATAIAVAEQKLNGEMASARKAAAAAQKDYRDFVAQIASEQLAKK